MKRAKKLMDRRSAKNQSRKNNPPIGSRKPTQEEQNHALLVDIAKRLKEQA